MREVVTFGDITVDIIARVPFYPVLGGDSLAYGVDIRAGGSAANTSIVLSKFGLPTVIVARVGEDVFAGRALADLREAGVELSRVQRDAEETTGIVFAAIIPDGERTFFSWRGANARTEPCPQDQEHIRHCALLHVSGYGLVEPPQRDAAHLAIQVAHESGVPVSVDLGVEVKTAARDDLISILPMVSMAYPNLAVAEWLTGESGAEHSVEALLSYGPQAIAVKLRDQGCLIGSADGLFRVPGFTVDAVDTTGAGDSFDAGLIAGRLGGLSLRGSALLANALGALATTVAGGGASLPGPAAALSFLEKQRDDPLWQSWSEDLGRVAEFVAQQPDR